MHQTIYYWCDLPKEKSLVELGGKLQWSVKLEVWCDLPKEKSLVELEGKSQWSVKLGAWYTQR